MVSAFPDLAEIIQYKMVRGSGASSSNPSPRWDIDLNLPPREEVEVPVEKAPEPEMDVCRERDPERIKAILQAQLQERISQKESDIRKVLEDLVQAEISRRRLSRSDFDFRNLDQFVGQVIRQHAQRFDPEKLEKKHESFSRLLTQLRKDDSSINYQVKGDIERNLLDFIVQE